MTDCNIDINNYTVLENIGSGEYGQVYKVRNQKTNDIYAVKVSNYDLKNCPKEISISIMREINILSRIAHPAVVQFHGYSPQWNDGRKCPVIATEYCKNGSLLDIIEAERRCNAHQDWNDTKKLITIFGIASAMTYLHSHNIIHRDLKPGNILMDDMLLPKVADFGLSKIMNENDSQAFGVVSGIKGTPTYMAPEILKSAQYSTASDVYAFAYVVYEIITNLKPFGNLEGPVIIGKLNKGIRPKFSGPIPDRYKNLIERCWAQDPEDRPTFSEIVDLLQTDEFLIDDLDLNEFDSYVDYINEFRIEYIKSRKIINMEDYLKKSKKGTESATTTQNGSETGKSDADSLIQENRKLRQYLSVFADTRTELEYVSYLDYEDDGSESIGEGAISKVTVVKNKNEGTKYARKILKEFDYQSSYRFLNEAENLFELRHPCVLPIFGYDFGNSGVPPSFYVSFEPYSLESAIEKKKLDASKKSQIIVEIVRGMQYIHSKNKVYNGLSPSQILLDENFHVKISGCSIMDNADQIERGTGTLRYMAPEKIEDDESPLTNKVDIYSFGILLIYIIDEKHPKFNLDHMMNGKLPTLPNNMADWVTELITKCLAFDPSNRPSFKEIFDILQSHDFDIFRSEKYQSIANKKLIERRLLEIDAYEFINCS